MTNDEAVLYSDFSKALLLHPGIVRIELLTDELRKKVSEMEHSPLNVGFTPIDPVGFREVTDMDTVLILFCSAEFRMFTARFMDIYDTRGNIVGHDVLEYEKRFYDSPDLVWLTDNLFIDMNLLTGHTMKTVIRSLPLKVEEVSSDVHPRVFYPSVTTAEYLNNRFGVTGKIIATVLVGADNVSF